MNEFIIDGAEEVYGEVGVWGRVKSGTIAPGMKAVDVANKPTLYRIEPNNKDKAEVGDDVGLIFKDSKEEYFKPLIGKVVKFSSS